MFHFLLLLQFFDDFFRPFLKRLCFRLHHNAGELFDIQYKLNLVEPFVKMLANGAYFRIGDRTGKFSLLSLTGLAILLKEIAPFCDKFFFTGFFVFHDISSRGFKNGVTFSLSKNSKIAAKNKQSKTPPTAVGGVFDFSLLLCGLVLRGHTHAPVFIRALLIVGRHVVSGITDRAFFINKFAAAHRTFIHMVFVSQAITTFAMS
jgi:hypothetical protein